MLDQAMNGGVSTVYLLLALGALVFAFFTFCGALLVGIVGYFIRSFHSEYKSDKIKNETKDEKLEAKMLVMTEAFGAKLESIVEKIGEKINKLPTGSDNLSQFLFQQEREMNKRIDEHSQRIQNNYVRTEEVAANVHALINAHTGPDLKRQLEVRRAIKAEAENKASPHPST